MDRETTLARVKTDMELSGKLTDAGRCTFFDGSSLEGTFWTSSRTLSRIRTCAHPVRTSYRHLGCGQVTSMGLAIAGTYARDPQFYSGTFCCHCGRHYDLSIDGVRQFAWTEPTEESRFVGE